MRTAMARALLARVVVGVVGLASAGDVEAAAEWAGVSVRTYPAVADLPAHQVGRSIWLGDDLAEGERRYVLAHELGHAMLDHGVSLYTAPLTLYGSRQESQADLFAGVLLLGFPGPGLDDRIAEATQAGIPDDCLLRFMNAARQALGGASPRPC